MFSQIHSLQDIFKDVHPGKCSSVLSQLGRHFNEGNMGQILGYAATEGRTSAGVPIFT